MVKAKAILLICSIAAACWRVDSFLTRTGTVVAPRISNEVFRPSFFSPKQKESSLLGPLGLAEEDEDERPRVKVDPLIKDTSILLRRLSWLVWWVQLILTTVASVTLLFARNVIQESNTSIKAVNSLPNFVLAGAGIALSFGSIFWTWATRRLSGRLLKKPTSRIQAANMLRKSINVGVTINILGMLFTLLGAEQIVGVLAIKVLTTSRTVTLMESSSLLQPLDILVVQANTNTLFSHFSSLAALLYLSKSLLKLDPPSVEGDERRR
jgi:hypothetical protein